MGPALCQIVLDILNSVLIECSQTHIVPTYTHTHIPMSTQASPTKFNAVSVYKMHE